MNDRHTAVQNLAIVCAGMLTWAGQLKQVPPFSLLPVDLTLLLSAATAALALASVLRHRQLPHPHSVATFLLLSLLAVAGALTTVNGVYAAEKRTNLFLLTLPIVASVMMVVRRSKDVRRFLFAMILAGAYVSLTVPIFGKVEDERLVTAVGATISFGRAAGLVLLACIVWLLTAERLKRSTVIWVLVIAAIEFYVLVSIGSRGPFQAVAIAGLVLFISQLPRLRAALGLRMALLSFAGIVLGAVAWVQAPAYARERLVGLFTGDAGGRSGGGRNLFYSWTFDHLPDRPFGYGWGSWARRSGWEEIEYVHNIFLEVWFEAGAVGLFLLLAALAWSFGQQTVLLGRTRDFDATLAGLVLVYWLATALVSGDVNENRSLLVVMVAVSVPTARRVMRVETEASPNAESVIEVLTSSGVSGSMRS